MVMYRLPGLVSEMALLFIFLALQMGVQLSQFQSKSVIPATILTRDLCLSLDLAG